jgi:hypothetical protein
VSRSPLHGIRPSIKKTRFPMFLDPLTVFNCPDGTPRVIVYEVPNILVVGLSIGTSEKAAMPLPIVDAITRSIDSASRASTFNGRVYL